MDRPLRQSCSCWGIKPAVLGAALSLGWPLPATESPVAPTPPPASSRWGFGPESWCQWHQRGRREVNCAATWDDRSRPSIRSCKDRQAPEHNPPLCCHIPGFLHFPLLICKKQLTMTRWTLWGNSGTRKHDWNNETRRSGAVRLSAATVQSPSQESA